MRDQGTLHAEETLGAVDETGTQAPADAASSSALALPRQGATARPGTARPAQPARQAQGSVLSPATWKQGVEALRELTTRKS
jgi:hypothetical protein